MRVVTDIQQGSEEWLRLKLAKISSTRLDSVMGSENDQLQLAAELIAEEGTEVTADFKKTDSVVRGTNEEPVSRKAFEEKTGKTVKEATLFIHDVYDWLVSSPDGYIDGTDYLEEVEFKNPDSKTLILYKIANLNLKKKLAKANTSVKGIPEKYFWQCVHKFLVNEKLNKLYFVGYDSRYIVKEDRIYVVELTREQIQEDIELAWTKLMEFRKLWLEIRALTLKDTFN